MKKFFTEKRLVFQTPPQPGAPEQQVPPQPKQEVGPEAMPQGPNANEALPADPASVSKEYMATGDKYMKAKTAQLATLDLTKLDQTNGKPPPVA